MPEFEMDLNGMTLLEVIKAYPEMVEAEIKKFGENNLKENLKMTMELVTTYRKEKFGVKSNKTLTGLTKWLKEKLDRLE